MGHHLRVLKSPIVTSDVSRILLSDISRKHTRMPYIGSNSNISTDSASCGVSYPLIALTISDDYMYATSDVTDYKAYCHASDYRRVLHSRSYHHSHHYHYDSACYPKARAVLPACGLTFVCVRIHVLNLLLVGVCILLLCLRCRFCAGGGYSDCCQ